MKYISITLTEVEADEIITALYNRRSRLQEGVYGLGCDAEALRIVGALIERFESETYPRQDSSKLEG